jgi:hypothetical protein
VGHVVLANFSIGAPAAIIPANYHAIHLQGVSNILVYQVYAHDAGIPCVAGNQDGDNGWVISEDTSSNDVIWFNHFTRGAHDTGLTKGTDATHLATNNRWLDNVQDGGYGFAWEDVFYGQGNLVEGNLGLGAGQLEPGIYKPGIELSGASTTIRRNIIVSPVSMAQEISSLNNINIPNFLVYNNIWYNSTASSDTACFWLNNAITSASGVVANNICTTTNNITLGHSYITDTTDLMTANDFVYINNGVASPSTSNFHWNSTSGGPCASSCTIAQLDSLVNPPWTGNASLAVLPQFVNPGLYDFHLLAGSPLLNVGAAVTDATWGSFSGSLSLGPFVSASSGFGSTIPAGVTLTGATVQ